MPSGELERVDPDSTARPADPGSLAIVGAGRVGRSLAAAAERAGLDVRLAGRDDATEACRDSDVALLCVPDGEIEAASAAIAAEAPDLELVGHTSGATSLTALAAAAERGAATFSLHPLQTFPDGDAGVEGTPCAVAGSGPDAIEFASALAECLGMKPFSVPEERRAAYHAAASVASNFLVALEESAAELLRKAGIDDPHELLAPLVLRTAANWAESGPAALTGPIARGDEATVERHRAAIAEVAPELATLYDELAERAREVASVTDETEPRMKVVRTKTELHRALTAAKREGRRVGLVPTMGCFHDGHLSLMRAARADCDVVVVSLFVNPTQFDDDDDLEAYPRDEDRDLELAEREGVDLLWAPPIEELYPDGYATTVEVDEELAGVLCGDPEHGRGPSHFRGVATVVAKVFNCVEPDVAFFGQKDAQQAVVIRRMVQDLDFPVEIEVLPTVREPGGLAMSSRNEHLTEEERERALALSRALAAAESEARDGERNVAALLEAARVELRNAGVEPEYLEARDAEDLSPVAELNGRPVLVAVAARVGRARLIDNTIVDS